MKRSWLFAIVPGVLALVVGAFVLALFLFKALWAWTVPDLFPVAGVTWQIFLGGINPRIVGSQEPGLYQVQPGPT